MFFEVKNYLKLGKFEEIDFIITCILLEKPKFLLDIENYCMRNTLFSNLPIKGILALLETIGVISYIEEGFFLTEFGVNISNLEKEDRKKVLVKSILKKWVGDSTTCIDIEKITFNSSLSSYCIKNTDIPLRYSNIRNLLINLDFFSYSLQLDNLLLINELYTDLLSNIIRQKKSKLSIDQLKEIQLKNEKYGEEAELFVLNFERKRLSGHLTLEKIKIISPIDTAAGFDIVSFSDIKSKTIDRFIEVKSYSGQATFYWSKNEVEVSKRKGKSYYLYLVNRQEIHSEEYIPIIICDPFANVFNNNIISKEAQTWFIKLPHGFL